MGIIGKLISKFRASLYVFKKAEIVRNIVNKEIGGEYDNLCHTCYFNERYQKLYYQEEEAQFLQQLRISIYLGGALGDYIVYLRFVDEISSICKCSVDLFLDRMEFAQFVYGSRQNITIVHDVENCLFHNSCTKYDLALHLDHGVTLRHANLGRIRRKAPEFYTTACKLVEYCKANRIDIDQQHERESVLLRRAKFLGETKWSKLSCGGAIDMDGMYSNLLLRPEYLPVLKRYDLEGKRYVTVNFGADKNMGGTAQTKVLPAATLVDFIAKFKASYPDYLVVQTGVKNSFPLDGADRYAFSCKLPETAILLKNAALHIDSEGGLVHLAAQLSTPSVVSFGPTPSYYYGYPRNDNIVSPVCSDCMSVTNRWSVTCPRGLQIPACMQAITGEMILQRVQKRLASIADSVKKIEEEQISSLEKIQFDGSGLEICLIGELTPQLFAAAQRFQRQGNQIIVYIPTLLGQKTVNLRTLLRQSGVQVEYGTPLNISRQDDSFQFVLCQIEDTEETSGQLMPYIRKECARLAADGSRLVWYTEENRENDTN